jgi:tyrosine-protein kinase Etk/Wzc
MDEQLNKPSPVNDEVHLLDYLTVLSKHSRMIVYTTIVVGILTLLILLLIPNKFSSTARIMPPQQNMTLSAQLLDQLGGVALPANMAGGGIAANLLGLKSQGDLYVGILGSNNIFDIIIERFDLKKLYKSWFSFNDPYIEDIREELNKRSDMTVEKEGLISIEVTDEDPRRAAEMANAFVEALDKVLQDIANQEGVSRLTFLEKERRKSSQNLAEMEEKLRGFLAQSGVLQIEAQTRGALEYIATLRASIDAKEVQIQVMRQQATPLNYDVIRLETELEGLKAKLKEVETQDAQNPGQGNSLISTSRVPALGLEYVRHYREVKYQEALFQLYSKLVELARLDTIRDLTVLQIVDRARLPEKKSKPKRLLLTVLIATATFFLMIFLAFTKEYFGTQAQSDDGLSRLRQLQANLTFWRHDARRFKHWLRRK